MVIKIIRLVFLLFLLFFAEVFSQDVKDSNLFSDRFYIDVNHEMQINLFNENRISVLHTMNTASYFTSVKTQSTKIFLTNIGNGVNHHPMIYAKLNFFGIDNLKKTEDVEPKFKEDEDTFWDNEIMYFVIGAVAATALYIVWQNSGSENPPQKTFGLPPKPQSVYGL